MKAIILISSIFYILGLKISTKIDLIKKSHPVEKIISQTDVIKKPLNCFQFNAEAKTESKVDSTKTMESSEKISDNSESF